MLAFVYIKTKARLKIQGRSKQGEDLRPRGEPPAYSTAAYVRASTGVPLWANDEEEENPRVVQASDLFAAGGRK